MGILTQHMYKSPAPIRALIPQPQDVPPGLEAIVLKCLSKKVELRYQSMDEVVADLERAERGMVPEAVQEMMGRSGGFNVPADYFRKAQAGGPAMMPATPPFRPKKPVLAMAIAGSVAMALVITGVVVATSLKAAPKDNGGGGPVASSSLPEMPASGAPGVPGPEDKIAVLITVDPTDAQVGLVDGKLQTQPVTLTIGVNEEANIRIERKNYVPQVVTLKGSEIDPKKAWRVFTLKPVDKPAPGVKLPPPTAKPPPVKPPVSVVAPPATPPKPATPTTCPPGQKLGPFGNCEKPLF